MNSTEHARPILTVHVGQAGVQIGNAIWELLCLEHNIRPNGLAKPDCLSNGFYDAVFVKSASGHFMPRSILVDTDPTCIEEVRVGPYHDLFSAKQLLSDSNDAGFNYMKGRHAYQRGLLLNTVDRFRWLLEKSDMAPNIFLFHSISGGTGSGFSVSFLEAMRHEFGSSIPVIDMMVSSGRSGQQNSCELINQVLYHYETKDLTNVAFSITNSAMYNMCRSELNTTSATYAHLNRMLAMCFSNLTSMERFPGTLPCNISSICNSVLPFRRLKHLLLSCSPFTTSEMLGKEKLNVIGITSAVMEADSQFADVDLRLGQHMAGVMLFRGAAKPSDVEQAVASLKANRNNKIDFVDWAPASFKTGLIELPPLAVPSSGIGRPPLSVTLVSNHTAVSSLFRGHSEGIKKLRARSFFQRFYDVASTGGITAGHNSGGVANMLDEACKHLDELVVIYESDDALQKHLQSEPEVQSSKPTVRIDRFSGAEIKQSEKLKLSEKPKFSSSVMPSMQTSGIITVGGGPSSVAPFDPWQTTVRDSKFSPEYQSGLQSVSTTRQSVSTTGLNSERDKSMAVTKDLSVVVRDSQASKYHPNSAHYSQYTPGQSEQIVATSVSQYGTVNSEGYVTPNLIDTKVAFSETPQNQSVLLTSPQSQIMVGGQAPLLTSPDSQLVIGQGPQSLYVTPKSTESQELLGQARPSEYIGSSQRTTTTETPGATPIVKETAGAVRAGRGAKKANSGGCCGQGAKKAPAKKSISPGAAGSPGASQTPLDLALRQRAQFTRVKRRSNSCCGGGGGGGGGATRHQSRVTVNRSNMRSQSQNHANSECLCYGLDSKSVQSTNGYSDVHVDFHPSNQDDSVQTVQDAIQDYLSNSVSTHTVTDSAADFEDIIKDCLPEGMSINCTISTVRQIIQKYNDMFAQPTSGVPQSATTVSRHLP